MKEILIDVLLEKIFMLPHAIAQNVAIFGNVIFDIPTDSKVLESPVGFIGLLDLINFYISHYLAALQAVEQEIAIYVNKMETQGEGALIDDADRKRLENNMQYVLHR